MPENAFVRRLVLPGRSSFHGDQRFHKHIELEATAQDVPDSWERNTQVNCVIKYIGDQVASQVALWPEFARCAKSPLATMAPVIPKPASDNPTLYRGLANE